MDDWRLITPPDNWRDPVVVSPLSLMVLEEVAERLGLVFVRVEDQRKVYLGLPQTQASPVAAKLGSRVEYPSGKSFAVVVPSVAEAAQYGVTDSYPAARLIQAAPDALLSTHFRAGEFAPQDSQYWDLGGATRLPLGPPALCFLRVSSALVRKLEELRAAIGKPIQITSGYRPPAYNRMVGGVSNSAHINGLAADIVCPGLSTEDLRDVAERIIGDAGGVGYYPSQGFVHIDVRGYAARWSG